jgi:hypothetical protein
MVDFILGATEVVKYLWYSELWYGEVLAMDINVSDGHSASLLRLEMLIIFQIEIPKGEPNRNFILRVFIWF